ncbi:hypothetical protein IQE94_16165 [Synechocystis sp. PCC 7339]|uniref:DUF6625 family protein n=1 Tax=Synechocystis sp. PCC 7339 TaxID=2782213 RepID=UPI001CBFAD03|nr:DUF6625 family protein [Synechocystis sp. PCC 7339]UAJ72562.1 hypothetical protein IQE94_16165 [Synechocystis sp. PCC 7339]
MKITFLIPYFGKWPFYTKLFLQSCQSNPCANFFILSDSFPAHKLPENVKHFPLKLSDFEQRVSRVLGFIIKIKDLHKVCDFRNFFPYVFSDILHDSDFWGYCDIDVVFGDLSKVLNPDYLSDVDILTSYSYYLAGHFTIFRNIEAINSLAFQIDDYQNRAQVFQSTHMDENGISHVLKNHNDIRLKSPQPLLEELKKCKEFIPSCINLGFKGEITEFPYNGSELATYKNGKVYLQSSEFKSVEMLYIHFMGLKKYPFYWKNYNLELSYEKFSMSQIGFSTTVFDSSQLNSPEIILRKTLFYFIARSREKIGHLVQKTIGISNARKVALFLRKKTGIPI